VVQEVRDLLEGGMLGEVGDLVPDVGKGALLAVDVGDLRVGRDDLSESLVGHAPPSSGPSVGRAGTRLPG
jgi:hypothetical protein